MLLRQVELALLLKTRASVMLTQGLELGPVLVELVREAALRRNGAGPTSGLLVLRAAKRRVGNLTPLECLVEADELRKDEFAVAVVLGPAGLGCGFAPALQQRCRLLILDSGCRDTCGSCRRSRGCGPGCRGCGAGDDKWILFTELQRANS